MKLSQLLLLLPLSGNALALSPIEAEEAQAREFASCAGYHMTRMAMMESTGKADEAIKLVFPTVKQAMDLAMKLRPKETVSKWASDAMLENARIIQERGQDGVGQVMLKYSGTCKAAIADPESRMKHWLAQ
jgi:hypothetical protein